MELPATKTCCFHGLLFDACPPSLGSLFVRADPFLLTHEIVEKALPDELRPYYLHAHQIALRAERDAVKAAGISWWAYQRFMKGNEKPIEEEKLNRVPPTLDLSLTGTKEISPVCDGWGAGKKTVDGKVRRDLRLPISTSLSFSLRPCD
jgi:hypothetical protein